jgi:UDP-N-acetylglucosamine transferase subunit ALG13
LIFATVGSSQTPFDRLVKAVDHLTEKLTEPVINPMKAQYFDFCDSFKMAELLQEADVVVAHAGFGVISDCIRLKKSMILVPREHRFGDAEGIQVELAEYLAQNNNGILCIREVKNLSSALNQVKNINPDYKFTNRIPELIQNFIDRRLL